jgi:hypothetical protein
MTKPKVLILCFFHSKNLFIMWIVTHIASMPNRGMGGIALNNLKHVFANCNFTILILAKR